MDGKTLLFDLDFYKQNFKPPPTNKSMYGEVNTPFSLIEEMLDLFPDDIFTNQYLRWLDPAAGCGYYCMVLYNRLMEGLKHRFKNREKRKRHILRNMLYMCEINEKNINLIKETFGNEAHIYNFDFLSTSPQTFGLNGVNFDVILGNPPYNGNGLKKVPTNTHMNKKQDGITLWHEFIKHSLSMLKEKGYLSMIVPSIWMKPDKANMNTFMLQHKLHKIRCFTSPETKKIFRGQAQTPTCFFLLQNVAGDGNIELYDPIQDTYTPFHYNTGNDCSNPVSAIIPLTGASIVERMQKYTKDTNIGTFIAHKTNLPSKHNSLSYTNDETHPMKNVKTVTLNGLTPQLLLQYSSKPCAFQGEKKIILGHKMYGFPFIDVNGEYGISNRDNYVITGYNNEELKRIKAFLDTRLVMFLYETTRYRMRYLEKYAFKFIPNILNIPDFPENINDETVYTFFEISPEEQNYLGNFYKHYETF